MVKKKHGPAHKSGGASNNLMAAASDGGFVGFSAFTTSTASSDVAAKAKPASSTLPPWYDGGSAEVAMACKSLGKRDATTKLKGMAELQRIFSDAAAGDAILAGLVPHFVFLYRRISLDNDRRVREALERTLGVLCAAGRRSFRAVMPELLGPWWLEMSDPVPEVANAAVDAWDRGFASGRHQEILEAHAEPLLNHLKAMLEHKPETLSDMAASSGQEADERYERVIVSTLSSLARLVETLVALKSPEKPLSGGEAETNGTSGGENGASVNPLSAFGEGELAHLLAGEEAWKRLSDASSFVRRAAYKLLSACCSRAPQLLRPEALAATALGSITEPEPSNHSAMWEAVLLFTRCFPNAWEMHGVAVTVLAKLFSQLRTGAFLPSAAASYPSLLPLLGALPAQVIASYPGGALAFYKKLFDAVKQGYKGGNASATCAAATAAAECAVHLLVTLQSTENCEDGVEALPAVDLLKQHMLFSLEAIANVVSEQRAAASHSTAREGSGGAPTTAAKGVAQALARLQRAAASGSGLLGAEKDEPWRSLAEFAIATLMKRQMVTAKWLAQLLASGLAAATRSGSAAEPTDVGLPILSAELFQLALGEAGSGEGPSDTDSGASTSKRELEPALVCFAATMLSELGSSTAAEAFWRALSAAAPPLPVADALDRYFVPWFLLAVGAGAAAASSDHLTQLLEDIETLLRHSLARLPQEEAAGRFAALVCRCLEGPGPPYAAGAVLKLIGSSSGRHSGASTAYVRSEGTTDALDSAVRTSAAKFASGEWIGSDAAAAGAFIRTCLGYWDDRLRDEPWISEVAIAEVANVAVGSGNSMTTTASSSPALVKVLLPVLRAACASRSKALRPLTERSCDVLVAAFSSWGIAPGIQQAWESSGAAALNTSNVWHPFVTSVAARIREQLDAALPSDGKLATADSAAVAGQLHELIRLEGRHRRPGDLEASVLLSVGLGDAAVWRNVRLEAVAAGASLQRSSSRLARRWCCLRELLQRLPSPEDRLSSLLRCLPLPSSNGSSATAADDAGADRATVGAQLVLELLLAGVVTDAFAVQQQPSLATIVPTEQPADLLMQRHCESLTKAGCPFVPSFPAALSLLLPDGLSNISLTAFGQAPTEAAGESLRLRCLHSELLSALTAAVTELLPQQTTENDARGEAAAASEDPHRLWGAAVCMRVVHGLLHAVFGPTVTDAAGIDFYTKAVLQARCRPPQPLEPVAPTDLGKGAKAMYVRRGPDGELRELVTVIGVHTDGTGTDASVYYTVKNDEGRERQTVFDRLFKVPSAEEAAAERDASRAVDAGGWRAVRTASAERLKAMWQQSILPYEQALWRWSQAEAAGNVRSNSSSSGSGVETSALILGALAPPIVRSLLLAGDKDIAAAAMNDILAMQRRWTGAMAVSQQSVTARSLAGLSGCFAGTPLVLGSAGAGRDVSVAVAALARGASLTAAADEMFAVLTWVRDACDTRLYDSVIDKELLLAGMDVVSAVVANHSNAGRDLPTCCTLAKAMASCVAAEAARVRSGGGPLMSSETKAAVVRWSADQLLACARGDAGAAAGSDGAASSVTDEVVRSISYSCSTLLMELAADTMAATDPLGGGAAPAIALGRKEAAKMWVTLGETTSAAFFEVMANPSSDPRLQACAFAVLLASAVSLDLPAADAEAADAMLKPPESTDWELLTSSEADRDAALAKQCLPPWLWDGLTALSAKLERVLSDDSDHSRHLSDTSGASDEEQDKGGEGNGRNAAETDFDATSAARQATSADEEAEAMAAEAVPLLYTWLLVLGRRPALQRAVENVWASFSACLARLGVVDPLMQACSYFVDGHLRALQPLSKPGALDRVRPWSLEPRGRSRDMATLSLVVFYSTLHALPAVVRTWWNDDCGRRLRPWVASLAEKFVSPAVVQREAELVAAHHWEGEEGEMSVHASCVSREVTATYIKDDCALKMTVSLPANYPLRTVEVSCTKRLGIPEARWRRWVLQIVTLLTLQDGSVLDAVRLWKRNVDKEFEGVEPCVVCYSVLLPRDMSLPGLECRTCKNRFHSACLYQWFKTSGKSKCPLCQQTWA